MADRSISVIAKAYSAKIFSFSHPQKFIPEKHKNFALGLNRKSFFSESFLSLNGRKLKLECKVHMVTLNGSWDNFHDRSFL